ncbi:hypothetical protein AB4238_04330 [Shewanella sp. 10N.286.45.A1]|uniref:hypothetical protein n=1 Tax=Shewanella sp. 10N.286.45.A1 TaxID=3229694 RepID=UPI00354DDA34
MKSLKIIIAAGLILFAVVELAVQSISLLWPISALTIGAAILFSCTTSKSNRHNNAWINTKESSWHNSDSEHDGKEK